MHALLGWPHRECLCEQEETGGDGISVWKGHNWTGPGPSDREDYCPNTRNVECDCENLLVTAHNADYTDDYFDLGWQVWAENHARYAAGEPLATPVDISAGY